MISTQVAVDNTYAALRSYHEAGMIDPGQFPEWLRKALHDIGLHGGEEGLETRLIVSRYKARLPQGLRVIQELYQEPYGKHQHSIRIYEKGFTPPIEPNYSSFRPLSSPHHSYHAHDTTYVRTGEYLHLNHETGILRLVYDGAPDPNALPVIDDNPILIDYLTKTLVYRQLNSWYFNGDVANIDRILQEAKSQYDVAYRDAAYQEKLPAFQELFHYKRKRIRSFR